MERTVTASPRPDDPRPTRPGGDHGSAMVITLMVLAVITALSTTVSALTINNLQGSRRAQEAGAALGAADAGIAQAMSHLRNNGVRDLDCTSAAPTGAACARSWGSAQPVNSGSLPGSFGQAYRVWIEAERPYPNPAGIPGRYQIHSRGTASGSASREVVTDVAVSSADVPKGIFAKSISGGGSASVSRASIFSTGCVYDRSKITMSGIDAAYGIPVGVHSSQIITESNGIGQYCPTTNRPIHSGTRTCDTDYPHDQDSRGGSLAGTGCASTQTSHPGYYGARDLDGNGSIDVNGSYIRDEATLKKLFGISSPALSQPQRDQMKIIARSQGNYWTEHDGWTSPDEPNAVMYFDLGSTDAGGLVDLNDITGFGRAKDLSADSPSCATRSLTIIVEDGNVRLNSNQQLVASLFLLSDSQHGQVLRANGNSQFVGTVYANSINLVGNTDLSMDPCYIDNISPALLDFRLSKYQELDR